MKKWLLIICMLIWVMTDYSMVMGATDKLIYELHLSQQVAGFHEIEGEIVSITADSLVISEAGIDFKLKLTPQVKIYCNGLAASWKALRPITANAFFDARAILNGQNRVVLLDGIYQGEECIIQGWCENKQQLCLQLMSVNNCKKNQRFVKSDALLPGERWLVAGQLVYVLYSREGKVRRVYLPDE